ncbi:hypothetical protein PG991_002802 [Apiospora marii]|uniref:Uncharacterized protein n=1 Tax=Apiospora marii TaxID=335849 RepID=A0ABR1SGE4_9PEZI
MSRSVAGSLDQSAVEEDEALSTLATVGSHGTPRADHEPQEQAQGAHARRPLTRGLVHRVQAQQSAQDDQQPVSTRDDILKWDDCHFRGLTPPPLPYETRPQRKKRAIQEIIADNSPREPDRMTREIEDLLKHKEQRRQQRAGSNSAVADDQRPDGNDQAAEKGSNSDHAAKRIKASSSKSEGG